MNNEECTGIAPDDSHFGGVGVNASLTLIPYFMYCLRYQSRKKPTPTPGNSRCETSKSE